VTVFQLSRAFDIPFLPWYAWSGIWAAFMHLLLAIFNACDLVRFVTRFSSEIFGFLIAIIYIANAIEDFIFFFDTETLASAMISLFLGLGTFYLASSLNEARRWVFFNSVLYFTIPSSNLPFFFCFCFCFCFCFVLFCFVLFFLFFLFFSTNDSII